MRNVFCLRRSSLKNDDMPPNTFVEYSFGFLIFRAFKLSSSDKLKPGIAKVLSSIIYG